MFEHMYKWSEEREPERVSVGIASQAEGTARAKVLDWDSGTARMLKWPEDSERGGVGRELHRVWKSKGGAGHSSAARKLRLPPAAAQSWLALFPGSSSC